MMQGQSSRGQSSQMPTTTNDEDEEQQ